MFHRQKLFLVNDSVQSFFLTLFAVFIYLYLAVLGLRCCVGFSLAGERGGYSVAAVRRLLHCGSYHLIFALMCKTCVIIVDNEYYIIKGVLL